jgi:tRNA-Thr(GGU) m(6)t(6)A37 methyltransferase TsaA
LEKKQIIIYPIGYVRTEAKKNKIKHDKKNVHSTIVLKKELSDALDRLDEFSHLYVIFYMHKVGGRLEMKVHPRGRLDLPLVGLFSSRTAHRPNPIGLTLVKLIKKVKNVLHISGLDAIDGTPILDIKPFDSIDIVTKFSTPSWLDKIIEN